MIQKSVHAPIFCIVRSQLRLCRNGYKFKRNIQRQNVA